MNRSTIRGLMRNEFLNEATAGFWTDANLNNYINLANQKVNSIIASTRSDFFTTSATFSTIANTKSYSLPTDCRFIRRMEIYNTSDASDITKLDELRFPRTEAGGDWPFTTADQPQRYIVRGSQFDLHPIPNAVYPMRIYYDMRKDDLALDATEPSSPSDFHDMIVYWASALACVKNKEKFDEYAALFESRKQELIQTLLRRGSDEPMFVEGYMEGIF